MQSSKLLTSAFHALLLLANAFGAMATVAQENFNTSLPNLNSSLPPAQFHRSQNPQLVSSGTGKVAGNGLPTAEAPIGQESFGNSQLAQAASPLSSQVNAQSTQYSSPQFTNALPPNSGRETLASPPRSGLALQPKGSSSDELRMAKPSGSIGAFLSMATSLAVVLLLFLGIATLYRKTQPASGLSRLPSDVIEVLGRSPAGPRQSLVVLKFGTKLVLISQQPGQTETLSEITDPSEVERLTKLCTTHGDNQHSQNNFANVLKQVASLGKSS